MDNNDSLVSTESCSYDAYEYVFISLQKLVYLQIYPKFLLRLICIFKLIVSNKKYLRSSQILVIYRTGLTGLYHICVTAIATNLPPVMNLIWWLKWNIIHPMYV